MKIGPVRISVKKTGVELLQYKKYLRRCDMTDGIAVLYLNDGAYDLWLQNYNGDEDRPPATAIQSKALICASFVQEDCREAARKLTHSLHCAWLNSTACSHSATAPACERGSELQPPRAIDRRADL